LLELKTAILSSVISVQSVKSLNYTNVPTRVAQRAGQSVTDLHLVERTEVGV